jgi:simple sugar transport system ATP-binding protein
MKDDVALEPPLIEKQPEIETPPLVEVQGISKRFPSVIANDDISLTIRRGEIHTLLGENGAGKSTLMNILSGMLQPDAGKIMVEGQEVTFGSPHDSLGHGIGTVYQHFTLVPNLSVIENVILGMDVGFILNLGQAEQRLKDLLGDFGLSVSPQVEVRHLSIGQQQRVEIIKVLFRGSTVLLLDEPTSVLTPPEVRELFEILLRLRSEDVAVVFITHKLNEALEISDRISILRQGKLVGELGPDDLSQSDHGVLSQRIVDMMFGGKPPPEHITSSGTLKSAAQSVCTLDRITALGDRGTVAVQSISLSLYAGEILGIAGVDGNGQKELGEVIAGQRQVTEGRVILQEIDITNKGTPAAEKAGIGYVTDDRLGEASVSSMSVADNLIMKVVRRRPFSRLTVLNRSAIEAHARRLIGEFEVKTPGPWVRVGTLSGGNIQKLLLARELAMSPKVLICNKPTHGLDVRTAQFVLQTLRIQADRGTAVLLISSELDEIMEISDRIGVMYNGRLLDVIRRDEADVETIGRLMLGVQA